MPLLTAFTLLMASAIAALKPLQVHSGRGPSAGIEAITL